MTLDTIARWHELVRTREVVGARDAALEFVVELDGTTVNGVDLISWGADGRITEFKVMRRPLTAVNVVHQKMAALLQSAGA